LGERVFAGSSESFLIGDKSPSSKIAGVLLIAAASALSDQLVGDHALSYLRRPLVLCHRGFDEYVTLAVYRGENAGGIDVKKVYVVDLTKEEKSELLKLVGKGEVRARKMNRAHILLLAEEDRTDKNIAKALHTSPSTVERTRRRLVEGGLEHALNESLRPGGRRKLTGKQEAYVVALACSDPPEGKKRWSMQMLADNLVELEVVGDGISPMRR
jgi:transposase